MRTLKLLGCTLTELNNDVPPVSENYSTLAYEFKDFPKYGLTYFKSYYSQSGSWKSSYYLYEWNDRVADGERFKTSVVCKRTLDEFKLHVRDWLMHHQIHIKELDFDD